MVILVMGVSGSGKTTVGRLLAEQLGWPFLEGDAYHPPANVDKMTRGEPLTDADRQPWLQALGEAVAAWLEEGTSGVLACSALTKPYRRQLHTDHPDVQVVYLHGDPALIRQRMEARTGHFMPARLLASQLATLEPPEEAVAVSIDAPPAVVVRRILDATGLDA